VTFQLHNGYFGPHLVEAAFLAGSSRDRFAEIAGPINSEALGAKPNGQFFEIGLSDFRVLSATLLGLLARCGETDQPQRCSQSLPSATGKSAVTFPNRMFVAMESGHSAPGRIANGCL
jgi:hypothetical protein